MTTQRVLKYIAGAAITAAVLFLVWYFSLIVIFILVSAVLAIMFRPVLKFCLNIKIRKWNMPRWMAAFFTLMAIWGLFGTIFGISVPLVFAEVNQLSNLDLPQVLQSLEEPIMTVQHYIQDIFSIPHSNFSISETITKTAKELIDYQSINNAFSSVIYSIVNAVVAFFSISFITFFFLKDDGLFNNMVISLFPDKYSENVIRALNSISVLLYRYFVGILAQCLIITVVVSICLILFKMDTRDAIFIGLLHGMLNVIPYAGPVIALILALILGVIEPIAGTSISYTVTAICLTWLFIKGLDDFFVQPALYSERVKAHPLEIFLVILIAGSLGGIVGMMLAVPMYTVIRVFAKEFFSEVSLVRKLTQEI